MPNTIITSQKNPLVVACATILSDGTYPSLVATATEPSGNGIIETGGRESGESPSSIQFIPFGTGSSNDTFGLRITGWAKTADGLWIPTRMATLTCTLGTAVGVTGYVPSNSHKFVDTITVAGPTTYELVSPADDTSAYVILDAQGYQKIQVTCDLLSGATGANTLYRWL